MPNVRGGKGYKKSKTGREKVRFNNLEEINVIEGEGYFGRIKKRLGGKPAQFEVLLNNGTTTVGIVRGKLHKKVWLNPGNLVLLNPDLEIIKNIKVVDEVFSFNDSDGTVCQLLKIIKICYPNAEIIYVSQEDMHNMPETKIKGITFETMR